MPAELPGYFYDEQKGKYFKITPSHNATPGVASSHTTTAILTRKRENERRLRANLAATEQSRATVQRSRISRHIGTSVVLDREIGRMPVETSRAGAVSVWAQQLSEIRNRGVVCSRTYYSRPLVTKLVADPLLGLVVHANSMAEIRQEQPTSRERLLKESMQSTTITSLCMDSTIICATSGNAVFVYRGAFQPFIDLGPEGPGDHGRYSYIELPADHIPGIPHDDPTREYFSSACTTNAGTENFKLALGCNAGRIVVVSMGNSRPPWLPQSTRSDILSVELFDEQLLLAGSREGSITFHDDRARGSVLRAVHPSSVKHIKRVDPSRFVAAGLDSQLHMYDLRFLAKPAKTGPKSRPYLSYSAYENQYRDLGFDVSVSSSLIAAATDDKRVVLLDLWSGNEKAAGWSNGLSGEKKWHDLVRGIAFIGEKYGSWGEKDRGIVLGVGSEVEKWLA